MSGTARTQILGLVRRSLRRETVPADVAAVDARLGDHPANLVPARARLPQPEQVALFVRMASDAAATVERVGSHDDVPMALASYLAAQNLPAVVRRSPDAELDAIPWHMAPALTVAAGRADPADMVGVTGAFAGIAETGTLMTLSGPSHPTTLNFLPDTHVIVMPSARVVGTLEEGWSRLRAERGLMPRTVNFITGPSRTADIEMTLYMGAHGPRRLHIILVGAAV